VVTGAGRGIGRAVALILAERGADVAVVDIDLESGRPVAGEADQPTTEAVEALGRRAIGIQADLTTESAAASVVAGVNDAWGGFDFLVNVAGGAITPFTRSGAAEIPLADLRALLEINLVATVALCQAAIPTLERSDRPSIVTTGSLSALGQLPEGKLSGYGLSKAAVVYYTRALAEEVGPRGIRVNCVSPGYTMTGRVRHNSVDTGFAEKARDSALRRLGEPEDIARAVAFLVSEEAGYITGHNLVVDGLTKLA
jgi:NAD(P)-dependent dehydrogenase (short-subunit alcohol dehydrogenase family)